MFTYCTLMKWTTLSNLQPILISYKGPHTATNSLSGLQERRNMVNIIVYLQERRNMVNIIVYLQERRNMVNIILFI